MTNDASQGRQSSVDTRDWESTALQRVAARHGELHDARSEGERASDWERHALECLRRYFQAQR
ncbi:MAG TPA: hypothetical protein VLD59_06965 [Steroidobacteraceae bacterium]|nr:hypothetical protein [Steroidobacteraceae bacterium]